MLGKDLKTSMVFLIPVIGGSIMGQGVANLGGTVPNAVASIAIVLGVLLIMASTLISPWREIFFPRGEDDDTDADWDGAEDTGPVLTSHRNIRREMLLSDTFELAQAGSQKLADPEGSKADLWTSLAESNFPYRENPTKGGHEDEARSTRQAEEEDHEGLHDREAQGKVDAVSEKEEIGTYEAMLDSYNELRQSFIDQGDHPDVATRKARYQLEARPFA